MIDITLFAEVMRITEDVYNEGRPESEKQHLGFADINTILANDDLSLDGEKLEICDVEKQTLESASADVHFSSAGYKPAVSK